MNGLITEREWRKQYLKHSKARPCWWGAQYIIAPQRRPALRKDRAFLGFLLLLSCTIGLLLPFFCPMKEKESFEEALKRELFEELGMQITESCPEVYYRNPVYTLKNGEKVQSVEKFFLVRLEEDAFSFEHWTESEKRRMFVGKWWSLEEIKHSEEMFFSKDVLQILEELSDGMLPEEAREISGGVVQRYLKPE